MIEPEWSLPMNRTELIRECERLRSALLLVRGHIAIASDLTVNEATRFTELRDAALVIEKELEAGLDAAAEPHS